VRIETADYFLKMAAGSEKDTRQGVVGLVGRDGGGSGCCSLFSNPNKSEWY